MQGVAPAIRRTVRDSGATAPAHSILGVSLHLVGDLSAASQELSGGAFGSSARQSVPDIGSNSYLIRWYRLTGDVVSAWRNVIEDDLNQLAWRAGILKIDRSDTADNFGFLICVRCHDEVSWASLPAL
jgi:hypothetical protein